MHLLPFVWYNYRPDGDNLSGSGMSPRTHATRLNRSAYLPGKVFSMDIATHSRAHRGHDMPVGHILEQAADEGPVATHGRFDWMDHAIALPEDAIAVFPLGQDSTPAGRNAMDLFAGFDANAQVGRDGGDVRLADICAAETLAAFAALCALEKLSAAG
jgi:hypothetical protein